MLDDRCAKPWVVAVADPYRDPGLECPACKATLREFQTRQLCDGCDGMLLTLADLAGAIHDLTSITPTFEYKDEVPGKRPCPKCRVSMTTCRLRIVLEDEIEKPRPELDRCAEHGIWFDGEELAKVFEKVAGKGHGSGVGRKSTGDARGIDVSQGRWSAMFKGFGRWGGGG
jgi:Zn-finger nucleic acid-binding protein